VAAQEMGGGARAGWRRRCTSMTRERLSTWEQGGGGAREMEGDGTSVDLAARREASRERGRPVSFISSIFSGPPMFSGFLFLAAKYYRTFDGFTMATENKELVSTVK
jgi:hypothetical protein